MVSPARPVPGEPIRQTALFSCAFCPSNIPINNQRPFHSLVKIKQLLKLPFQGNAQNQRKLCRGIKLPGLDGADGVPGHAHHLRQLALGEPLLASGLLQAVLQYQLVVHNITSAR